MIRVFRTHSGLKKTVKKVYIADNRGHYGKVSDAITDIALIPFSKNSLSSALRISKGICEASDSKADVVNIKVFIEKSKNDLILAANEGLSEIFKYASINGDNCSVCVDVYDSLSDSFLGNLFSGFDFIVFFLAVGATVRLISPHIKDKLSDPGVVAIDDLGRFAVSLLSGHIGGGNEFTKKIADFLGAVPVITTATDISGRFAVDMFAKRFGFSIEEPKTKIKLFNKASLNGGKFVIYITDAELNVKGYLTALKRYTANYLKEQDIRFITCASELKEYIDKHTAYLSKLNLIVVSGSLKLKELRGLNGINCAVLRPKNLVIGIGCNKNTSFNEIDEFVVSVFCKYNLSLNSVRNIATIDIKSDENGILQCLEKYARFIDFYTKEEINGFMEKRNSIKGDVSAISKKTAVYMHTGAYSVCEPCALLSADNTEFLICKQKKGNVTMAVAVTAPTDTKKLSISAR